MRPPANHKVTCAAVASGAYARRAAPLAPQVGGPSCVR
jgi:hypothetical protein